MCARNKGEFYGVVLPPVCFHSDYVEYVDCRIVIDVNVSVVAAIAYWRTRIPVILHFDDVKDIHDFVQVHVTCQAISKVGVNCGGAIGVGV